MPNEINSSDPIADEGLIPDPSSSSGVKRRLILGFGATALGPLVSLILQIVNVPVFLHFWGPELYGEWLLISAIPTYLAMSDMGFGTVAGNDMTMRAARQDYDGAIVTFQSTWKLVTLVSLGMAAIALPLLYVLPLSTWLKLQQIPLSDARLILVILAIDSLACLQTSLPVSGFKAAGLNHFAALGINFMRLIEGAGVLIAVIVGYGPVTVACILLVVRALGNLGLAFLALHRIPWLRFGFKHATSEKVKELLKPALAFMAFPAANAINLQGAVLAIGIILGPTAVTMFSPLRTVARTALQLTETLKLSAWPELSAAYGAGNMELARKLHRLICQLSLFLSCALALMLSIFGPWVLRVWTHGRIPISLPTFYFLLAGVVVNSLWNTSSTVPIAANRHGRIAVEQLLACAAALGVAIFLMHPMKLPGAALGLLLGDVVMVFTVLTGSLSLLNEHFGDFIRSLFDLHALFTRFTRKGSAAKA